MSLDKAKQAIKAAYKPGLISEWDAETCLQAVLPHLEKHFAEVMAQRLEAAAWASFEYGNFKAAARFLRESDR